MTPGNSGPLTARITYLEMRARPSQNYPRPTRPKLAVMRGGNIPVAYYRYLYEQVGREYHWYERRKMDDDSLEDLINAETTQIDILYADGCPAGYFELDSTSLPDSVQIAYFGLCQNYVGLGLGKWFLSCAVDAAWDLGPERVCVHTNTLDHPRALPMYQKIGFAPVGIGEETIPNWE